MTLSDTLKEPGRKFQTKAGSGFIFYQWNKRTLERTIVSDVPNVQAVPNPDPYWCASTEFEWVREERGPLPFSKVCEAFESEPERWEVRRDGCMSWYSLQPFSWEFRSSLLPLALAHSWYIRERKDWKGGGK